MKILNVNTAVYKHKPNKNSKIKEIAYFMVPYKTDCYICLDFPDDPKILECRHILCEVCMEDCYMFYGFCPICKRTISKCFSVRWLFFTDYNIGDKIKLVKIDSSSLFDVPHIDVYSKKPFYDSYYENITQEDSKSKICKNISSVVSSKNIDIKKVNKNDYKKIPFYQSEDGQLIFLNPKSLKNLIFKHKIFKDLPEYIILKIYYIESYLDSTNYTFLEHLDSKCISFVYGEM
ncbi:hypothetical protein CWI38_0135p0030 [Hamiltosporidium tvaerminnensis]|uniref:RING-type domain-containing protein n=2 Tax=Hamiltosporidium TaxID=1176354 RepID=A0A4Q9LNQ8_9MICR|nr:hypothetical protein CWI39_1223p0010 [Hamiltosporidium magnivora]TBU09596.1 hypothetical protein CWI36_0016p0030 [Hamiltosporidium magnivora]TBU20084.1 hypothetical protein CWI38_0135p0030 [Hamiltosporidium tvaerminnensis]